VFSSVCYTIAADRDRPPRGKDRPNSNDYPQGRRKPSCLVFGLTGSSRPLHVQCTCPPDVAIVTAYEPKPEEWVDWTVRK